MHGAPNVLSGAFAGRYTIERELGRGGTATVYLARDNKDGRSVAIKVLKPELAQSVGASRFLREIKLTARLHHPNILRVLDSGDHGGQLYFVLPVMKHGTLRHRMLRERQLPLKMAIAITRTIAGALDYAHRQGFVHRDVKPENILFSDGEVCLADFGIARAIERSLDDPTTSTGIVRGTPAYMSPEQASGEHDYDGRSDVYSLACVLYEMIAGMPAFVGPTAKSVMAQRLLHPPRAITVYRPNIPQALEATIRRALEVTPADRFETAAEFSSALALAVNEDGSVAGVSAGAAEPTSGTSARRGQGFSGIGSTWNRLSLPRRRQAIGGSFLMLTLMGAGLSTWAPWRSGFGGEAARPDTTRLALLPLEGRVASAAAAGDDDLLQQAVAGWKGVNVVDRFQVTDALRQTDGIESPADAAEIARTLGAGRYIRGETSPFGNTRRTYLALYDIGSTKPLHTVVDQIPSDMAKAALVYSRLVESLLLRGASSDSLATIGTLPRSLPAAQAFSRAQTALDEWDLAAADSSFQLAVGFDPDYARANLWLAQVRAWREPGRTAWSPLAERANALKSQLSPREQNLAEGLLLLAKGEPSRACDVYDRLRARNDRDFSAWFGLGQCRMIDRIVLPDRSSPSGWRFRSSASRAMHAFGVAFELLPSVHRGYERGAFERLQDLLLVSSDLKVGYGVTDSAVFYARPSWMGDSLALIPYPWKVVFAGDSSSIPPGFEQALARRRAEFKRIAAGWSEAFPSSHGAKYAVAVALELLGDPAAIDTIRLARRLASDPLRRTQLAATEVLMLIKFGIPDDTVRLRAARVLADSLLADAAVTRPSHAQALAPLASMSGRCAETDELVRRMVPASGYQRIPAALIADANVSLTRIAIGCRVRSDALRLVASSLVRAFAGGRDDDLRRAEQTLLYRAVILAPSLDPTVTDRVASGSEAGLMSAAHAMSRKDAWRVRASLIEMEKKIDPGTPTPDITLARAQLWSGIGDRARAIRTLDTSLESVRRYDTKVLDDPVNVATLMRAVVLRAELAAASGDVARARRWKRAATIVWSTADDDVRAALQSIVK